MALSRFCPSCLSFSLPIRTARPALQFSIQTTPSTSLTQIRTAASTNHSKYAIEARRKKKLEQRAKQAKKRKTFLTPPVERMDRFSLVDAMRYIRAAEVGYGPSSPKYELSIRLRTLKDGAVVRGQLRLPHPVSTALRICVIAAPDSPAAKQAITAGASLVGEETVFDAIKEGRIEFDRCICHEKSLEKLNKSGVARILGPRGLMPSTKTNTVLKDVKGAVENMQGGITYRERRGVIRLAIGQLGHTPEEMQTNIKTLTAKLRQDFTLLSDRISKEIHEIVLSSTHGPGMSLTGEFKTEKSIDTKDLSTL